MRINISDWLITDIAVLRRYGFEIIEEDGELYAIARGH